MIKVITYGTYDLLHYGHIRLLERAKALGDYLIVGVTADDFDKTRGKINVQQSLSERIEAVRSTGLADEIIVEEFEGQKIDDIRRYNIDIFTVGSDWEGKFDYLKEYCKVIYLERTEGVSSSEIRGEKRSLMLGIVGDSIFLNKVVEEAKWVNGLKISGICSTNVEKMSENVKELPYITSNYPELLDSCDAVYIHSHPDLHYNQVKTALQKGKHVLCESPIALEKKQCDELYSLARKNKCVLVDALRTAYATAYYRLLLLAKTGKIGKIISIDAVCTSLKNIENCNQEELLKLWNSITAWGPTALLPVFQILGTKYKKCLITTHFIDEKINFDAFTKIDFLYPEAVASIKVGSGVKAEGELVVTGTKGYIYVPAPWWKTDYFEVRFENPAENKRYFYQLDGEGIRYELADFMKTVENKSESFYIDEGISKAIVEVVEMFQNRENTNII